MARIQPQPNSAEEMVEEEESTEEDAAKNQVKYEMDIEPALQDAINGYSSVEPASDGIFDRNLRQPIAQVSLRNSVASQSVNSNHRHLSKNEIIQRNRKEYFEYRVATLEGRRMEESINNLLVCIVAGTDELIDGVDYLICEPNGWVGSLPCNENVTTISDLVVDLVFGDLEISPLNEMLGFDMVTYIKEGISSVLNPNPLDIDVSSKSLTGKVCADDDYNITTLAEETGVDTCEDLDMLSDTDVVVVGYFSVRSQKGFCVAFHDGTDTYAFSQYLYLPEAKFGALTMTLNAIAISFSKELSGTSLNDMWDGSASPAPLTVPGHFLIRLIGYYGLSVRDDVKFSLEITGTVFIDLDLNNDVSINMSVSIV